MLLIIKPNTTIRPLLGNGYVFLLPLQSELLILLPLPSLLGRMPVYLLCPWVPSSLPRKWLATARVRGGGCEKVEPAGGEMRNPLFSGIYFVSQVLFCFCFFFSDSLPLPPIPPNDVASGCLNPAHSCANGFSTLSICLFVFLGFSLQSAILYKQNYPFMSYPFRRFLLVIVNCGICGACLLIIFPAF